MNTSRFDRTASIVRHGSRCLAAVCIVYFLNYWLTPMLVGEIRLQVALRPHVYTTLGRDFQSPRVHSVARYGMVNTALEFSMFEMMGRTATLAFLGEPDVKQSDRGKEVFLYRIATQGVAPVRSILFPGRFKNDRVWTLRLEFEGNSVVSATLTLL